MEKNFDRISTNNRPSLPCESKSLETQEVGEFEIRGSLVAADKNMQEDLDQKINDKQNAWSP
jgi:hypothetical protein